MTFVAKCSAVLRLSSKVQCTNLWSFSFNIHREFYDFIRDLKLLKEYLNIQNLTVCYKILLCFNDFTFFSY